MKDMTLREVCNTIGVSRRAIQGYEKESLVSATGKTNRGYLLYDTAAQERIKKIKLYQDMGFSLKQIKLIIDDSSPILKNALIWYKRQPSFHEAEHPKVPHWQSVLEQTEILTLRRPIHSYLLLHNTASHCLLLFCLSNCFNFSIYFFQ